MQDPTEALAADTRTKKQAMERAKRLYHAGHGSFDELEAAARAFCDAFAAWHLAKYGKRKRPDWRAVIR